MFVLARGDFWSLDYRDSDGKRFPFSNLIHRFCGGL
jgi:hypothetical protein